jgi:hypothetical protein
MRRRMKLLRPKAATCAALLAGLAVVSGCGENPRPDNASREGLPEEVGHIEYNVYITRELNLRDIEDKGYFTEGEEAPPGHALYGVFLEACNLAKEGGEEIETAGEFVIEDTQGNKFEPLPLAEDNIFAYKPEALGGQDCIPEEGTLARSSPTNGSLLVFELPLETLENRPLQLIITAPDSDEGRVELDI